MTKRRGNGEGTIGRRKDGRWEARLIVGIDYESGKPKRAVLYGRTRAEVQHKMQAIQAELRLGSFVDPSNMTVKDWLERWSEYYAKPSVRISTWESYDSMIRRHLVPALGSLPLQGLRPEHLQRLYNEKLRQERLQGGRTLSPKTVAYMHTVLKIALKQAVREQLVIRNVADAVVPPRAARHEITPLSPQEMQQFLHAAQGHRFFLPFLLECVTGLRRGELLGLRWQDVDFDGGAITIRQSLVRTRQGLVVSEPKTPKSRRTIPLPGSVLQRLAWLKQTQAENRRLLGAAYEDGEWVFCNAMGHPVEPHNLTRQFEVLLKRAGLPVVRFHDLRHSHATMLLMLNEHPKVVQERLGHSTVSMTLDTYSHILPGLQEAATKKVGDLLNLDRPFLPKPQSD